MKSPLSQNQERKKMDVYVVFFSPFFLTVYFEKICTNARAAERSDGREMAEKIQMRIGEITAADTIEMMVQFRIGRCHPLTNNRKGQYAVDLVHPYRLVFEKHGSEIQIAHIMEIADYH